MSKVTAILADTVSIQKYVYSSNRLKENIGASSIIANIYKESLANTLEKTLEYGVSLDEWEKQPETIAIKNSNTDFEVGYIGGGNALLFFNNEATAKEFISEWTRNLLLEAPSLNVAFAISEFNIDNFQNEMKNLFKQLEINKSKYFPQTFLPKHGITADCPYSGLSAEVYKPGTNDEKGAYISSASYAKYKHIDIDDAKVEAERISNGKFSLTTNIEKLGQTKGQNHIAIVHIDGNSMAEHFKSCENLVAIRKLSKRLKDIMQSVYEEFLNYIFEQMDFLLSDESGFNIQLENGKYIIPFRPILREGDDITFITDGRLGIPFAQKYLELMSDKTLYNENKLSACAGVAIIKTKYPFFRGYNLTEELCQSAKREARENKGTSWLDFHISYGGFSGTLEGIRKNKYTTSSGQLHFGPYLVASSDISNEKNIFHLKRGIKTFKNKEEWPRSKVKEFREYLTLGKSASQQFIDEARFKGRKLYGFKETSKTYNINVWQDGFTPYFDMIELMDLIPEYFLAETRQVK
ncbi:MAG: hypothetical protein GXW90_09260 [Tepidanaerobacter acetatoxydans]|uniref:Cas10/Cmr2 second palm domain-containing protein n=1 Tax=Tepidanaerobacter acetatoxydans TaxID=499229 RepID=UPI0026EFEBF0|nr:hypothetical protein [Tepidanaerobacter acetatoxydans]NLU11100.1 hypothetical protein [Tepidanaerobacter acetatoxydans]